MSTPTLVAPPVERGAMLYVWVPAAALAHALAVYWLAQSLLMNHPGLLRKGREQLVRLRAAVCCRHGTASTAAAAEPRKGDAGGHGVVAATGQAASPSRPITLCNSSAGALAHCPEETPTAARTAAHDPESGCSYKLDGTSSGDRIHRTSGVSGGSGNVHVSQSSTPRDGFVPPVLEGGLSKPVAGLPKHCAASRSGGIPGTACIDELNDDDIQEFVDQGSIRVLTANTLPVSLEWRDLGIQYSTAQGVKTVLDQVHGSALARTMTALIGPSGAGKSTLLDILAMRPVGGHIAGAVLVNGHVRDRGFLKQSAYVPQEDNFLPQMTVAEVLTFHARLALPLNMPRADKAKRVQDVLAALGLVEQRNTLVGGILPGGIMLRGVSGGERKRINIAAGIISQPSVIFLDEPTSGLDSFAALSVMAHLRHMALAGHTVVASIHQPRAAIWGMFDRVLLLSKGVVMYEGYTNGLVPWFTDVLGYTYDPELNGVPSDWVMDLVCVGFSSSKERRVNGPDMMTLQEVIESAALFRRYYTHQHPEIMAPLPDALSHHDHIRRRLRTSSYRQDAMAADTGATGSEADAGPASDSCAITAPKRGVGAVVHSARKWWNDYVTLCGREVLAVTRNPADAAGRLLLFADVGIISNLLNYGLLDDANSIRLRISLLFAILFFYMVMPFPFMSLFTSDKKFFLADSAARLYGLTPYYFAKLTATLPFNIIISLVFGWIGYGMLGLRHNFVAFVETSIFFVLMGLIALQWVYFATAFAANQDLAFSMSVAFAVLNIVVSSFFLSTFKLSLEWINGLKYISALDYSWQGVVAVELRDRLFSCAGGVGTEAMGVYPQFVPNTGRFALIRSAMSSPGANCVADGNALIGFYKVHRSVARNVGCLLIYLFVLHVGTFLAMKRAAYRGRAG